MSGIGFNESVDLKNGEGFCGRPQEDGFKEKPSDHRHCYNDGFTGVYELAVKHGFTGTERDYLNSLRGRDGKSAYRAAVEGGFTGSEDDFNFFLSMRTDYAAWVGTVEEYNALTEEEKNRDKVIHYIIEEV